MTRSNGNNYAIKAENISLSFMMRHDKPTTLKEAIVRKLRGKSSKPELFWALKDVSFTIEKGERLGVIGLNGSGKTTLLSLVAGIYPPDEGRLTANGRVVALLGLGVGFDPEMTGRENIPLNASLYGLSWDEIADKMENIIAFAGIGDFIDSPVRTYSSGMTARLGFAVAAHLDADIILLDEVLAVGDAPFRKKCLERMKQLRDQGKTMLYVAHDLYSVREMCHTVIWLDKGKIIAQGPADEVVDAYEVKYDPGAKNQPRG